MLAIPASKCKNYRNIFCVSSYNGNIEAQKYSVRTIFKDPYDLENSEMLEFLADHLRLAQVYQNYNLLLFLSSVEQTPKKPSIIFKLPIKQF